MTKYVKLEDALECAFDFFMTEESDRVAFKSMVEDECEVIDNAQPVDIKDQIAGAYNEGYMCGSREAEKARPKGLWETDNIGIYCSVCKKHLDVKTPFCPLCGADMRKGGADNGKTDK